MHEIRSILSGRPRDPLARQKKDARRCGPGKPQLAGMIRREEARKTDQRRDDRYLKLVESAVIRFRGRNHPAEVLNVSSGGAMIRAAIDPRIGARVDIRFEGCNWTQSAVRWVRGTNIGLEFTTGTVIIAPADIRELIVGGRRSGEQALTIVRRQSREPRRHLIWKGILHWAGGSIAVKLRNVSARGAMLAAPEDVQVDVAVVLELEGVEAIEARVMWCRSGQIGIRFGSSFDLTRLARSEPAICSPAMLKPDYLASETRPDSPWAAAWDRLDPDDLSG